MFQKTINIDDIFFMIGLDKVPNNDIILQIGYYDLKDNIGQKIY